MVKYLHFRILEFPLTLSVTWPMVDLRAPPCRKDKKSWCLSRTNLVRGGERANVLRCVVWMLGRDGEEPAKKRR
jgi:hypothetical protein